MTSKSFISVVAESTCLKRVTVCELFNADGRLIARESNRCNPPNGICARATVRQGKEGYAVTAECNWAHAEARALDECIGNPVTAIVYGHDFACPECERKLRAAGVADIQIIPKYDGVGIRG